VTRRRFLARVEGAAAATAVSCLGLPLSSCLGFHYVNATAAGDRVRVRLSDLGGSRFALVDVPQLSLPIYLYRDDTGAVSAVSTRCMHRGCQVEPAGGHLVCPCHGSEYDNRGGVLKGPTRHPLVRFQATVEGGEVVIHVPPGVDP